MKTEIDLTEAESPMTTVVLSEDDLRVLVSAARVAQTLYHEGPVGAAPLGMIEAWEKTYAQIGLALARIKEAAPWLG